jgi:hypothetical protein
MIGRPSKAKCREEQERNGWQTRNWNADDPEDQAEASTYEPDRPHYAVSRVSNSPKTAFSTILPRAVDRK